MLTSSSSRSSRKSSKGSREDLFGAPGCQYPHEETWSKGR
jgi:hypothetical protein